MRLGIDATPISPGGKGLSLFLESFLDHIVGSEAIKPAIVYVDESCVAEVVRRWPGLPLMPVRCRPALLWEKVFLPRRATRDRVDVLFTGRDRTVCEPRRRTVVYLFEVPNYRADMILKSTADWYAKTVALLARYAFTSVARKVTHFVVSSKSTRKDLISLYNVPVNRISVIYPGIHPQFHLPGDSDLCQKARRHFTNGKPYVLHFATGDLRDNTTTALAAFSRVLPRLGHDLVLLLVGVRGQTRQAVEKDLVRFGLADHACITGFVEGDALRLAYAGAEAYLDPTLYEGFGMQLVEAMACGVPVVSSNVTSVPEIVGDAGFLYHPMDVDGFALGLERVILDRALHADLAERAMGRARLFSWERAGREIASFLESMNGT